MEEISIYIHFPYCESKCPYCDFNSHTNTNLQEKEHIKAFKNEIDFFNQKIETNYIVRSIFFGGGTPSLMSPSTVFEIIEYIKQNKHLNVKNTEITLEANPSSSEYQKFKNFKDAGVNRLSIGVQSFKANHLKFLGRRHNEEEAKNALLYAKEIFQNYSFDLIYCLPNQSLEEWATDLENAIQNYASTHISAYTLTIEKGTKFFKMHKDGEFSLPSNEDEFYLITNQILTKYGFNRYEISNYAKTNYECRHNLSYWEGVDYIGIGAGAHGRITINNKRYATQNFANPQKYLSSANNQKNALQVFKPLSKNDIIQESLVMNLRSFKGLNLEKFKLKHGFDILPLVNQKNLQIMQNENLLYLTDNAVFLTEKGMNLANSIAVKLY
jgi:putative oxygen-independent coproporphyrinogen III oxidase